MDLRKFRDSASRICILIGGGIGLLLAGCSGQPTFGIPVSGSPDGDVEVLEVTADGQIEHSEGKFLDLVDRQDQTLVMVDFWASWCGPCRQLSPVLDRVKTSWGENLTVVKVDIDSNEPIARHFQVNAIPDVRIFRNGKQVGGFAGMMPQAEIEAVLKSLM